MVLMRNLHPKRKDNLSRGKLHLNNESLKRIFKGTNGSAVNLVLRSGRFTANNVTLVETSINNKILRVPLNRYNFNGLRQTFDETDSKVSRFGRSIKRKRNSDILFQQSGKLNKRIRVNGSSTNSSEQFKSSNLKNVEKSISRKMQKVSSMENLLSEPTKTFDKAKFKIRLASKTNKKNDKKTLGTNSKNYTDLTKKSLNNNFHDKIVKTGEVRTFHLEFLRNKELAKVRLNYKFQKLVTDVKNMNLPTASWKIKVIIKQNKISAITFTNKQDPERSVTFTSETYYYRIIIDNKSAYLLGSPETIETSEDIEILLDIVEHLDPYNPVIFLQ